jgi:hydroxymethylpyrimidine pyrophosphatase-like HAD family hydrolase
VVLNTLRFPLNVIRTFGREWYSITNAPLPLITLNGSQSGYLAETSAGKIVFEEITAFPLTSRDCDGLISNVERLVKAGLNELLLFIYPRNWMLGEQIWTPEPDRVERLQGKYTSADHIFCCDLERLADYLRDTEVCMIFMLIDAPDDRLMAYQHSKRSSFITRQGVDKLSGALDMAVRLDVDLHQSIGAGDTPMDTFLKGVGLAVHVGANALTFQGLAQTVRVDNSQKFGETLFRLSELTMELTP